MNILLLEKSSLGTRFWSRSWFWDIWYIEISRYIETGFKLMSLWFLFTFRRCLFRDMNAVVCHDECIGMSYLCLWFCKQHELVRWWMCLHMNWRACDILYVCLLLFFNVWEWASCLVCVWELDHREKCVCVSVRWVNSQPKLTVSRRHTRFCPQLRHTQPRLHYCEHQHRALDTVSLNTTLLTLQW